MSQPIYLQNAIYHAGLGIPVEFFLGGTKECKIKDWPNTCTTDIAKLIRRAEANPTFTNYALVARAVVGGNCFLDDDGGIRAAFEAIHGKMQKTLRNKSCSGNFHYVYKHSAKSLAFWEKTGKKAYVKEVNPDGTGELWSLRMDSAYIVGPGSVAKNHLGELAEYKTDYQAEITEIPDNLLEFLIARWEPVEPNITSPAVAVNPINTGILDPAAQEREADRICHGDEILRGAHDTTLTTIGGNLRRIGLDRDEIETRLVDVCEKRCVNHGTDYLEMCRKIAVSVAKYPMGRDTTNDVLVDGKPAGSSAGVSVTANATISEVEVKIIEESNNIYPDMPDDCLGHGTLAYICRNYMGLFPRSYAFPALLTVAGTMIPLPAQTANESIAISSGCGNLTNLYTCLVGEIGSGKSQAIRHAVGHLNLNPANYDNTKAGSIEGLLKKLSKQFGPSFGQRNRIMVDLDEWSHLFKKAGIDNAAFVDVLNSGFSKPEFHLTIAGGEKIDVACAMSLIGGMVTDKVEECFGSSSVGGFHDRFLFGIGPTVSPFEYLPFDETDAAFTDPLLDLNPSTVTIRKDVWRLAAEWRKADPTLGRSVEVTIRCGVIIAAFDNKVTFTAEDLQGLRPFLDYQVNARRLITPNAGTTNDAKMTNSILSWLNANTTGGEWTTQRSLKKGIKSQLERLGPMAYNNSIRNLVFINAVELNMKLNPGTRPSEIIRLIKGS